MNRSAQLRSAFLPPRTPDSFLLSPEQDHLRGMRAGEPVADLATRLSYLYGALAGTPYDDYMLFTDDSYWEPDVDYTTLAPFLGTICTRGGGPSTWTEGQYGEVPDKYWFQKAAAIRATGLSLGGYWVVNFGEMINDFTKPAPIIDLMKTAFFDKWIPDWIALDIEIEYFYRGGNKVTIPGANLAKGLDYLLEAVWEEFKKTTFVYSRASWMDQYGRVADGTSAIKTVLDAKNSGGTRFPLWLAYYPQVVYTAGELSPDPNVLKGLLPPKTDLNRKYLEYGLTNAKHIAVQWTPKKTWKGVPLDWSTFPMTKEQWNEWIQFTPPTQPPQPPEGGNWATKEDVAAVQSQVDAVNAKLTGVHDALA